MKFKVIDKAYGDVEDLHKLLKPLDPGVRVFVDYLSLWHAEGISNYDDVRKQALSLQLKRMVSNFKFRRIEDYEIWEKSTKGEIMKFKVIQKAGRDVVAIQCRSCNTWHELEKVGARFDDPEWALIAGKVIVCRCGDIFELKTQPFATGPRHRCDKLPARTVVFKEYGKWQIEDREGKRFSEGIFTCPFCGEKLENGLEKA